MAALVDQPIAKGAQSALGVSELGAGASLSALPEAHIAQGEPHQVRVVAVPVEGVAGRESDYFEVCSCGWVSLSSVWRIVSPRGCDVSRAMREGVRNRRIFDSATTKGAR